jgi:hypothetical protein
VGLRKNVFIVFTEYQFLQALNIASGVFNSLGHINHIFLVRKGKRLMNIDANKNWLADNIKIQILDNEKPKKIANLILNENPNHFLFFQAISALNVYLAYTLAKRGAEISLGPDGYNAYAIFNKNYHFLSIIKDSFKENYFLFKQKLFTGKIHRFDYYTYGNNRFINNLWITYPEQYKHQAKNKVNILKLPEFNELCIGIISDCFNFTDEFPTENAIYFFNQPLWSSMPEKEYNFLKQVIATFPQKKIVIKLHPLTSPKMKANYKNIDGLDIIESSVPAEVLLLRLKNCIVFSGWSSVLITENKNCNYYFNYPVFKEMDDPILNQIDILLLDHITMIKLPEEMEFPNE